MTLEWRAGHYVAKHGTDREGTEVEVIDGGVASGRRVVAAEKRERAWELRKRGLTYRKIAEVVAG